MGCLGIGENDGHNASAARGINHTTIKTCTVEEMGVGGGKRW
jgi:hypothetical protein